MATKTNLAGKETSKDNLVFEVLGDLDEVSAVIGLAKAEMDSKQTKLLTQIQKDLSFFSSILAQCQDNKIDQRLNWLEKEIRKWEKEIDISEKFVLSGENELESRLNFARVVARKAERKAVKLSKQKDLDQSLLDYLNRLSWLLFLLTLESRH